MRDGLDFPHIAYVVANDRSTITNLSTAQPENDTVTLYYASPNNAAGRVPIIEVRSNVADQFYVAPNGSSIAYLVDDPLGLSPGLYIADIQIGLTARVSTMNSTGTAARSRCSRAPQTNLSTAAVQLPTTCPAGD